MALPQANGPEHGGRSRNGVRAVPKRGELGEGPQKCRAHVGEAVKAAAQVEMAQAAFETPRQCIHPNVADLLNFNF